MKGSKSPAMTTQGESKPRWKRPSMRPLVSYGGWIAAVSLAVAYAAYLPFPHSVAEGFSVQGNGGGPCGHSMNFSTPYAGTLSFSWTTNTNVSNTLLLIGKAPGGSYNAYDSVGVSGEGSVLISPIFTYDFNYCGTSGVQIATIHATISYLAPLV